MNHTIFKKFLTDMKKKENTHSPYITLKKTVDYQESKTHVLNMTLNNDHNSHAHKKPKPIKTYEGRNALMESTRYPLSYTTKSKILPNLSTQNIENTLTIKKKNLDISLGASLRNPLNTSNKHPKISIIDRKLVPLKRNREVTFNITGYISSIHINTKPKAKDFLDIKTSITSPYHIQNEINKSKQLSEKVKKSQFPASSRNTAITEIKTDNVQLNPPFLKSTSPVLKNTHFEPQLVISTHRKDLADYEISEIEKYNEIYYWGNRQAKLVSLNLNEQNFGWDNEKGFYIIKAHDHIAYRYEVFSLIGKGSFGHVFKCYDHKYKEFFALKILRNKKKFHAQGKIEISILKLLNETPSMEKEYIVKLHDSFLFRNHIVIM